MAATTERETIPPDACFVQSWVMRPDLAMVSTSGSSERAATSASKPPTIARACAPLPRYDSWKVTVCPVESCHVCAKAGRISP